jgi:hypothetical protein
MNEPMRQSAPSFVPLLQWLEDSKLVPKGTVGQVNDLADRVKGLGDALKRGGVIR